MSDMTAFNATVFRAIHGLSGRNFLADGAGIFFAAWLPYLMGAAFFVLVFTRKEARRKFYAFAEGALAVILARGIVTPVIQYFWHEPRPFSALGFAPLIGEAGWAFPSAHMTLFFALATAVWYADRKWGTWYFILAAVMGAARIYVGVRWPLDILAGAAIGIASAAIVHWTLKSARAGMASADGGAHDGIGAHGDFLHHHDGQDARA